MTVRLSLYCIYEEQPMDGLQALRVSYGSVTAHFHLLIKLENTHGILSPHTERLAL